MVTYEAMNLMVSFATLIVAVIAIGISSKKCISALVSLDKRWRADQ